ncbi:MAG TPA: response regulator [Verrucomicrobiae bacterium]|jgi:CheY-like chemotaxis protein|nr:response regulator [Verrucomicrobiae bacterium]
MPDDALIMKEVYSPADIALLCKKDVAEVRSWMEQGLLRCFQVTGGHLRVTHESLSDFMEAGKIEKPGEWNAAPQKLRVLVVEDDPDLLEIISELLKEEPRIEVRAENNGFTAGLQIAGWYPDLVLLDFLMPGISGFELCARLRENEKTSDLPVLAMTSLTSIDKKREIYESGVSDFLGKPFRSQDLLHKVRLLLGLDPAYRTASTGAKKA